MVDNHHGACIYASIIAHFEMFLVLQNRTSNPLTHTHTHYKWGRVSERVSFTVTGLVLMMAFERSLTAEHQRAAVQRAIPVRTRTHTHT